MLFNAALIAYLASSVVWSSPVVISQTQYAVTVGQQPRNTKFAPRQAVSPTTARTGEQQNSSNPRQAVKPQPRKPRKATKAAKPKQPSAGPEALVGVPICTGGAALQARDCNRALLALGGGIQGAIQELKVDGPITTGQNGGCKFTVTAVNGGTINISKGRLERAVNALKDQCGFAPGSVTSTIGSSTGPVKIEVTSSATKAKQPIKPKQPSAGPGDLVGAPVCNRVAALQARDCNRALLALGSGIQGAIQELKVDGPIATGQNGGCKFTVTAVNGGTIKISKGRLERAVNALKDKCGVAPGSVTSILGSSTGPVKIEVAAV